MKKMLVLTLVLSIALCAAPGLAAGKLSVTQENFHVIDSYRLYGYAYARVDNVGDKPIKINAGVLEIFDAEGDALTSTDYIHAYAEYLQPDEYTYVYAYDEVEDVEASEVDDYMLTITGKSDSDYVSQRFSCTADYEEDVKSGYSTYNYMYATFTNDTDAPVYDITVVMALLDADDNILYMENIGMYTDKALMPGSSVMVREAVSSSFLDAFEAKGMVPVRVDAIAFATVQAD